MTTNRRLITIFASVLMAFAFALFVHADPAFADDPPQTTNDGVVYGLPDVDLSDNGIPVLSIDIDPEEYRKVIESEKHTYRAECGSISITVPEGYTGDYGDTPLPSQEDLQLEYLRGRGNSTWMDAKKPFKFKLKKKKDLLGMGANKHWVLLASAFDGTMLRNRVVGYMGRQLGLDFTPMYTPVDLVVNGQYRGSYLLAHQVRIGENRVDIPELTPANTEEPEVTGGYLLQYAPYGDEGEQNIFTTKRGSSFAANNPVFASEDEDDTLGAPEQRDYIFSYLQQVEDAVFGEGFKDENGVPYTDLMDVRAAAAYWMIQEFTRNTDAFGTPSTYLYKDRGGKLCWGPLWDSDLTFDPLSGEDGFNHCEMYWLDYLRTYDPVYQKELKQVWKEYDPIITDIIKQGGLLDRYAAELQNSWDDNKALAEAENWAEESFFQEDFESLEEEVFKLREFITARQEWFRGHIDTDLTKACCKITLMADGEILDTVYEVYGNSLGAVFARMEMGGYSLPPFDKDGYVAAGWNDENGNPIDEDDGIYRDMTISVRYIPDAEAIFADGLYFAQYEVITDINSVDWSAYYTITPENAQETSIAWSTSDPEIADVDEKGLVTFKSTGDVTVTGKLRSGVKTSCLLHIRNTEDVPKGPVRNLIPESDSLTLKPGEYGQNPITLDPNTGSAVLSYESSDDEVAMVDDVGVIHAISPGTCLIKVTEENSDVETSFTVVVEDNSEEVAGLKAKLTEYVTSASRDLATGKYTADTVKALKKRIAEANDMLDDRAATVRDIDIAQVRLLRAWRLLEPVDQAAEEADRILHEEINALAKELIDVSEKVKPAVYTTASYKTLSTAIAKAKQILADDTSTAQQLRDARTQLLKARQALKKKSANTLKVKGKNVKLKAKKLKKKAQTVKRAKAVTVSKPRGTVKYTLSSVSKAKFKKYFKVNAKTGKITVKKGLKKGTYTVKLKVSAAGNGNYLPAAKTAKVIVKVK